MSKDFLVSFVSHDTAEDLVVSYFRRDHPRMRITNLMKQETEFEIQLGDEKFRPGTVKDMVDVVEEVGIWGYCTKEKLGPNKPIIHFWVGEECKKDKLKIMELFSHESAHAIGYRSEAMARKVGSIGAFAYMSMMEEVFGESFVDSS